MMQNPEDRKAVWYVSRDVLYGLGIIPDLYDKELGKGRSSISILELF